MKPQNDNSIVVDYSTANLPTHSSDRFVPAMSILGIGTATPEHSFTQTAAAEMAEVFCGNEDERRTRFLKKLYTKTGVNKRHSVLLNSSALDGAQVEQDFYPTAKSPDDCGPTTAERMCFYDKHAPRLAQAAAESALENARVKPSEVTHLVTVSCSGFAAPGVDTQLIERMQLPATTQRSHIGFMGCHGSINGMRVARSITATDPNAVVLLCAVELCTIHQQYGWDQEQAIGNALFADGAAAIVGIHAPSIAKDELAGSHTTDRAPNPTAWRVVGGGSKIVPASHELMRWQIGNHGFRMTLSREVPTLIEANLGEWLHGWLGSFGLTTESVGCWAVHPGGPKILEATANGAGIAMSNLKQSFDVLANYGNMSSPTVLFVLEQLRAQRAKLPCVVLGFGPGLAIEAVLIA